MYESEIRDTAKKIIAVYDAKDTEILSFEEIGEATRPKYRSDSSGWDRNIRSSWTRIENRLIELEEFTLRLTPRFGYDAEDGRLPDFDLIATDPTVQNKCLRYIHGQKFEFVKRIPKEGVDPLYVLHCMTKGTGRNNTCNHKVIAYSLRALLAGKIPEDAFKVASLAPFKGLDKLDCNGYNHILTDGLLDLGKARTTFQQKGILN